MAQIEEGVVTQNVSTPLEHELPLNAGFTFALWSRSFSRWKSTISIYSEVLVATAFF